MAITFAQNTYAGEAAEEFIVKAVSGNSTVNNGHIYIQSGVNKTFTQPRLRKNGNFIQPYATGAPSAQGGFTIQERALTPTELMVYTEFNPMAFRAFWEPFQPSPTQQLLFTELTPNVQRDLINLLLEYTQFDMAQCIWTGDTVTTGTAYPNTLFDGLLTKALSDPDGLDTVIDVTPSGVGAFTSSNIEGYLKLVYQGMPKPLVMRPDMKIFCSITTAQEIQEAANDISGKGPTFLQAPALDAMTYNGKRIVPLEEFPDNVLFAAESNATVRSNLHMAVTDLSNHVTVKMGYIAENREDMFFKMIFKAAVGIGNIDECVILDARS